MGNSADKTSVAPIAVRRPMRRSNDMRPEMPRAERNKARNEARNEVRSDLLAELGDAQRMDNWSCIETSRVQNGTCALR
jgi:hypothetical protein